MNEKLREFKARVMEHTEKIWVEEPRDVYFLKKGYSTSGAGIHNQYFTTTVMLSGEIRALGVHIFPDLLKFARSGNFTAEQLCQMSKTMVQVDVGVISYFGLKEYGSFLEEFQQLTSEIESVEDFIEILNEMFTVTNRYQLWLHQIFPWYLSVHFPKANPREIETLLRRMKEEER